MGIFSSKATRIEKKEEEFVCRICLSPKEEAKPLKKRCNCRGSIKYVHDHCLRQWIRHSKRLNCEICRRRYRLFKPVDSEPWVDELRVLLIDISKLLTEDKVFDTRLLEFAYWGWKA